MTDLLPPPLTPADCDLRGLPFMPLDVIRLLDSDMFAETTGEEFKAAVALWCKSWTQIPAASLPNKDKVLAKLSQSEHWKKVKDGAMRGWILCSDDRWYHPVVAEKALAALPGREEFNSRKSADAERKAREREDRKALFEILRGHGVVPDWNVSTKVLRGLAAQHLSQEPPDDFRDQSRDMSQQVTVSKGEGEGEREGKGEGELTSKTEASSQASTEVREPAAPAQAVGRNVAISILLRGHGIDATAANPIVCVEWAENPKVTDDLLTLAAVKARTAKPDQRISVNYLKPIVAELLAAPEAKSKSEDRTWRMSDGGIERKGRELGMFARGGETHRDFAARIQTEIDKRKGAKP